MALPLQIREKVSPMCLVQTVTHLSDCSKRCSKSAGICSIHYFLRSSSKCQSINVIQNSMCYRSGIMSSNEKTISFRAVPEKIEALDSLAAAQERPRSYFSNEAITNYIELHAYQDALV